VRYQLGAAEAMARAAGGRVRHLKLHGALSNMASEDEAMARVAYEAALEVNPRPRDRGAGREPCSRRSARRLGCAWAGEIFADRAYEDDATLVDRRKPGRDDPRSLPQAGPRIAAMVRDGAIHAASGKRIPARIDTVCVHGDGPEALAIARAVRAALEAGVTVARL
jgi:5-oxoprolinase (ATP-hydrolysing) subunit A